MNQITYYKMMWSQHLLSLKALLENVLLSNTTEVQEDLIYIKIPIPNREWGDEVVHNTKNTPCDFPMKIYQPVQFL